MRHCIAITMLLVGILTGCGGGGVSGVWTNESLPVAHPRDAAAKVNVHVAKIEKGLAVGSPLIREKNRVHPGPCGADEGRRHVKGWDDVNANPNHESWYVEFSPYSISVISWMDLPGSVDVRAALVRLRDVLKSSGWRIVSFEQPGGASWELKAESPDKGYGGIIDGPGGGADGRQRIGVTFSSPCFRHPDALPKS